MSDLNNMLEKSALRKFLLDRRTSNSNNNELSNNIHVHIEPLINSFDGKYISIFQAYNNEINTNDLIKLLISKNFSISLPCINDESDEMLFREWNGTDQLISGKYGILEPNQNNKIVYPSVLFIPLLAFDENGNRLGYGGGYYDKYIEVHDTEKIHLLKIGVGYSFQKIHEVPNNINDKKLNWILTEKYLYKV
ncbi:5-formyltetrahydrofolate cyclo-ligase [Pelagibacteraceae bacterium]|nr:5-formyltetrahydrofolate cyclo-ligase [Pelagibacteraceae bacterium]